MENKNSKYLKYAIGEIILVVIGILIALQINNWNENRKTHQKQIIFLNNVKQDLTNDLIQLNDIITYQTKKLNMVNELKDALISEKKDFKKIESVFTIIQNTGNNTFFANTGAYTTSGTSDILENLKPETLKIAITTLYERYYKRLIYNGEVYDARTDEIAMNRGKYYIKLTSKLINEAVINDSEFLNLTSVALYNNSNYVSLCTTTKIEIENILAQINKNLKHGND
jgi:predicted XRE-type DNA-binding protein